MQSYDNSPKSQKIGKTILSDFLGFLKYKVDNDLLTLDEEQAIMRVIEDGMPLHGTSDDFAEYYKQSPINVRSVICRKMLDKPKRKVLYSFAAFSRIIPESWRK